MAIVHNSFMIVDEALAIEILDFYMILKNERY